MMENNKQMQVFITFSKTDASGKRTRESVSAKQLARRLESSGVRVFLKQTFEGQPSAEEEKALEDAQILVLVAGKTDGRIAPEVRADYDAFLAAVRAGKKTTGWRVVTYLLDIERSDLPAALSEHYSFSRFETDGLVDWVKEKLEKEPAKNCISDTEKEEAGSFSMESVPEFMPESAPESAPEAASDDDDWEVFVREAKEGAARQSQRMRRAADDSSMMMEEACGEAANVPNAAPVIPPVMPPMPSMPSVAKKAPVKVKPQKINKADFSVVAPEKVKPGSSGLVDVLMYTKGQRAIVQRVIEQSKEKATEAARSAASVSVRQGSEVTVVISSEDAVISENSETLVWNGDALDFSFRFSVPEDYKKKQLDFSCHILFDGIHISRLYFSVPINAAKSVPIRFVRKDSKRAFVSYSHKDKQRVVDQLTAIQSVAPKLRFWMDSQSMSAGDLWRPSIKAAIKAADVFLLFWSRSSKESSEVRKEWEYALKLEQGRKRGKNGARFISPVPLDNPRDCPPPPELDDLHFGDPSFDAEVEHIEEVNFVVGKRCRRGNIEFF